MEGRLTPKDPVTMHIDATVNTTIRFNIEVPADLVDKDGNYIGNEDFILDQISDKAEDLNLKDIDIEDYDIY